MTNYPNTSPDIHKYILVAANSLSPLRQISVNACIEHEEHFNPGYVISSQPTSKVTFKLTTAYHYVCLVPMALYLFFRRSKAYLKLTYKNIHIGRYVAASVTAARSGPRIQYPILFLIHIYRAIHYIDWFYSSNFQYCAIFFPEPFYMHGLFQEIAIRHTIPIYTYNHPHSFVRILPSREAISTDFFEVGLSSESRLTPTDKKLKLGREKIQRLVDSEDRLSYMHNIPYKLPTHLDLSSTQAVVYMHSFVDAMHHTGPNLTFRDMYDWLDFTLFHLQAKHIILKVHPVLFRSDIVSRCQDIKLFSKLVSKYSSEKLTVIDFPTRNSHLLSLIPRDAVVISHHGNALLEAGYLGFKAICSSLAPWHKYQVFNEWSSTSEYNRLLNELDRLVPTNLAGLFEYIYDLHCVSTSASQLNSPVHAIKSYLLNNSLESHDSLDANLETIVDTSNVSAFTAYLSSIIKDISI